MYSKKDLARADKYLEHMTPKEAKKLDSDAEYEANKKLSQFD